MRGLAAWLALAVSDPAPPAAPAPVRTPPAAHEVGEFVVIAPRAAREPDWSRKLNLDAKNRYGGSDTPYLRQRPTNGCKFMAGGARSPSGASGAAGGLVCAKSF